MNKHSYSFYCTNCGDHFSTPSKLEVKEHRKNHYEIIKLPGGKQVRSCTLLPTNRGTLARPSLIAHINKEVADKLKTTKALIEEINDESISL